MTEPEPMTRLHKMWAARRAVLGEPTESTAQEQADARVLFSFLLDWMVEAGDTWLLGKGPREDLSIARAWLRNDIKRELLALTSPSADDA